MLSAEDEIALAIVRLQAQMRARQARHRMTMNVKITANVVVHMDKNKVRCTSPWPSSPPP